MEKKGFDPEFIRSVKKACEEAGNEFVWLEKDVENGDYAAFQFVGEYEGKEVVFDAFISTLEMEYFSGIFEDAISAVIESYPEYEDADFDSDEGHHIDLMEDYADELAGGDDYDVSEFMVIGDDSEQGLEMELCLNVPEINEEVISGFIADFRKGTFAPDPTFVSFSKEE